MQAPGSMSLRGLRLTIDNEGRRSHGGSLALCAGFTRRFQQASPLVKKPDSHPIPLPFPEGVVRVVRRCCEGPQVMWRKDSRAIGVSGTTRRSGSELELF